jgi:uncharacterized RDD family membrane protein YckC
MVFLTDTEGKGLLPGPEALLYSPAMGPGIPQVSILRMAAFVIDILCLAILLVVPAAIISYLTVWIVGETRWISLVWYVAILIVVAGALLRDGYRGGRSPGKKMLGLRLTTKSGKPCGIFRSIGRNVPLIIPLWNLAEVILVLRGGDRSGDRIAGTSVLEE